LSAEERLVNAILELDFVDQLLFLAIALGHSSSAKPIKIMSYRHY